MVLLADKRRAFRKHMPVTHTATRVGAPALIVPALNRYQC